MRQQQLKFVILGGALMLLGADSSIVNWPFGNLEQLFVMVVGFIIGILGLKKSSGIEVTLFGSILLYFGGKAFNLGIISVFFQKDQLNIANILMANWPGYAIILGGLVLAIIGLMEKKLA